MPQGGLSHKPVWPAQANGFLSGTGNHLLTFLWTKMLLFPLLALGASPGGVRTGLARMDIELFLSAADGSSAHHTTHP